MPRTAVLLLALGSFLVTTHAASVHKNPADAFKAAGLSFHHFMVSSSGTVRHVARETHCEDAEEGDGARVCRAVGTADARRIDPFLMMDHFDVRKPAGFPNHPHRGQETVTLVLEGAIKHTDSMGNVGTIGPGDVQWMTAGSGVIHEEMPATDGKNTGIQLWVNLPADKRMTQPRYQELRAASIPSVDLMPSAGAAEARVIAGALLGTHGPAHTHTPILIADVTLEPHTHVHVPVLRSMAGFVYVIEGEGYFGGDLPGDGAAASDVLEGRAAPPPARDMGKVGHRGSTLHIERSLRKDDPERDPSATDDFVVSTINNRVRFYLALGEPIGEPIASAGPFVMNTQAELRQAFEDYENGNLVQRRPAMHGGRMAPGTRHAKDLGEL